MNKFVIQQACNKWFDIGLELLKPKNSQFLLNMLEDHTKDNKQCCVQMFDKWLKTERKAKWRDVIAALRSPSVQLHKVAKDIESMCDRVSYYI